MKIAVTGANGFVGRALITRLSNGPHAAIPLVRKAFGLRGERVGDVLGDPANLLAGAEAVIHLAARVHVMHDEGDDALSRFRAVNVAGTLCLARAALDAGIRRFVFVSSVKAQGETTSGRGPYRADEAPSPEDPYGISKRETEDGLRDLCRGSPMELVIVRPPLVYGPGVGGNFATMVRWVERGIPLPLGRATMNRRSLIAVENLADFLLFAATEASAAGGTFLISDGEDVSTAGLLKAIGEAAGKPARLVSVPVGLLRKALRLIGRGAEGDRLLGDLQIDTSEACDLGWVPPVSMAEQLRRTVPTNV